MSSCWSRDAPSRRRRPAGRPRGREEPPPAPTRLTAPLDVVLGAEEHLEHVVRHAEERPDVGGLAGMGPQRRAPLVQVGADVDLQVDLLLGHAEGVAVIHGRVRVPADVGHARGLRRLEHAAHQVAVHRRLQHPGPAGRELGAAVHQVVDLDVVGVAVAAVPVVADHDVGALLIEDLGEPARGLLEVCEVEGARVVVLLPPGHAGVGVAEPGHPGEPEDARGRLRLAAAAIDHSLTLGQVVRRLPVVAVRREHHHDAVPLGGGTRHGSGGLGRLVIGMGMHVDDGGHGPIMHRRPRRPTRHT